ncbi:MAG: flagellin lysine-N-methylase [Burkholderiaceae bacterium]|jgi:lysine-N-methylase
MSILHPTRSLTALVPLYAQKFSCVGSSCKDSCCTGWTVTIDKKTFNSYRQSKNPNLIDRLEKQVKRQRSQASDKNYARIVLSPSTGECPMMEDKLCSVQSELGEDKLSHTCFSYPRSTYESGDFYQQALTLSCPEAARLALLADDAFQFSEAAISVRKETIETLNPAHGLSLSQMNEIRFFCIQLMRTEGMLLWQKLALLGLFCESLTLALKEGGQARVSQIIASSQDLMLNNQTELLFNSMQPHYDIQAITFLMLWRSKSIVTFSPLQTSVHKSIALGLGFNIEADSVEHSQVVEQYKRGINNLHLALKDAPFLLENYILNELFNDCFPFDQVTPYEHYLRLITRFGMVRFMIAAQCSSEDNLPKIETLVDTVQAFCRRYQHDSQFSSKVNACLNNSGWNDLQKIFRFLKT